MSAKTKASATIDLAYLRSVSTSGLREMLAFLEAEAAIVRGILERRASGLDT